MSDRLIALASRSMAVLVLLVVMQSMVACQFPASRPRGVPADAVVVASGNRIHFDAPSEGYLYLVSEGEIIAQRRLAKGQNFTAIGDASPTTRGPLSSFIHATAFFQPTDFKEP